MAIDGPRTSAPYRDVARARRLTEPPRPVPGRLRALLYFGGVLALVGWLLLGVGSVVSWAVGSTTDWSRFTVHGPYDHYDGRVIHTEVRRQRKGRPTYVVSFAYRDDERAHRGVSYSHDGAWPDDAPVTIEVPRGRPDQAVILGLARKPVPFGVWLMVTLVPLVGAGLVTARLVRARREVRLLARGRLGQGRLVHREPTSMRVNNRPVEKLSFDFEDTHGRVHRTVVRTHQPERITDEALEPLVYDPRAPEHAALLDALPGSPRVDLEGQLFFDGSPWTLLAALGPPIAVVLVNLVAAALVL